MGPDSENRTQLRNDNAKNEAPPALPTPLLEASPPALNLIDDFLSQPSSSVSVQVKVIIHVIRLAQ